MFSNPYTNAYNPQASIDRINTQIAELERMKQQIPPQQPQPTNLTQNFQLAPANNTAMRYANSIDEVQKDFVIGDTPFFSKDMSVVWVKNTKGEVKTYELNEIVPKDEKDLQIEFLMAQINELKGKINNEQYATNVNEQYDEPSTTENDGSIGTTVKENKSTSISRISNSKKK